MRESTCRLHPGEIVRIRAERWVVQQQSVVGDAEAVDVRGADATNGGQRVRFLLPYEPIERLVTPREPKIVRPTEWRRIARGALSAATASPDSLRAAARARLDVMPYQLEPALAVTAGRGCRLLIADAVGLGKTIQAGLVVAESLERNPAGHVLVVCPASLRAQWQDELQQRFDLSARLLDSSGMSRLASDYDASANPWSAAPLVITSIDFVKRPEVMRGLEGLVWDVLVLDEAHNLATRSDRATAAAALAARARTVVMLTATPHSGDEPAFARLCALGDLHGKFPLVLFRRTRRDAGIPVERRMTWLHVRPTFAEARMHAALVSYARRVWREPGLAEGGRLAMTVLLRRAASSAESLTRSLERRLASIASDHATFAEQLTLPFSIDEADEEPAGAIVAPGLADAAEEQRLLEELLEASRLAAIRESKVAAVLRFMSRVRQPVLIFTEYRDTLARLRRALESGRTANRIVELHGGLTRSERECAERGFATGQADVLLATDAASEGLNLHHRCRCVLNLEIPWNPVRLEQRIGRVDRIGQGRRVHAVQLVASDTFELTTVRRLVERARAAEETLRNGAVPQESTTHAILTGGDLPELTPAPPRLQALHRLDLSARAQAEARRIVTARMLTPSSCCDLRRAVATTGRPVSNRLLCALQISVDDANGLPAWTTLIGVEWRGSGLSLRTRADVRDAVASTANSIDAAVQCVTPSIAAGAVSLLHRVTALAVEREQAIAAAVRLRHARIAADLLQPGLFDRRSERRAASQSLMLEEALGRCHARLESLARLSDPTLSPPTLRFAIYLP